MQNICVRKSRSVTDILLLCEDQFAMMVHIFANHSKYFFKQNLYSSGIEKAESATVILLLSEDHQCPRKHIFANHSKYFLQKLFNIFVKPVQRYFCFGNLDPPQLSCCYLRISVQRSISCTLVLTTMPFESLFRDLAFLSFFLNISGFFSSRRAYL